MSWKIAAILMMLATCLVAWAMKKASDRTSQKTVGVFYQFFSAMSLAWLFYSFFETPKFDSFFWLVCLAGLVNSSGGLYQWKAYALSLSKTSLLFPLMGLFTALLGVIFLGEKNIWNAQMFIGIAFYVLAVFFLLKNDKQPPVAGGQWLFYTVIMIFIFAGANFANKLFSLNDVSVPAFIIPWYTGSSIGALLLSVKEKQNPLRVETKNLAFYGLVGALLIMTLSLGYLSFRLGGPVSQVVPLQGIALSVIPSVLGLYLFGESKNFSKREWLGFALGLTAAILILLR